MAVYLRNTRNILRRSSGFFPTVAPSSQIASASTSSSVPVTSTQAVTRGGALRPHLGISVNPNHGLYGFFRVKSDKNSHTKPLEEGKLEYVALEPPTTLLPSGRAWEAPELRRKSFKDLHTLWYVVLRERNLLATQAAEKRRLSTREDMNDRVKAASCQKTMARIKAVISERRYAYKQALRLRRLLRRNPALHEAVETREAAGADSMLEEGDEESLAAEKTP